jgi:hypothetical protein
MSSRTYPPSAEQAGIFKTFLQHHLRQTWERWAWPEVCQVEQEYFAEIWTPLKTYVRGNVVFYSVDLRYYIMIRGGTTLGVNGGSPLDKEYWAVATPTPASGLIEWDPSIAYAVGEQVRYRGVVYQLCVPSPPGTLPTNVQAWGEVPAWFRFVSKTLDRAGQPRTEIIGEFFGMTLEDPRTCYQPSAIPFATQLHKGSVGGLVIEALPWVWVHYRKTPPQTLADDSTIPARFSEIIALRAAAAMLRTDGKSDQAGEFEGLAGEALQAELDKVVTQEAQGFGVNVGSR